MFAVVTTEAADPVFVTNVVRVRTPGCFHFWKEIVRVNALDGGNKRIEFWISGVLRSQRCGDFRHGIVFIRISAGQYGDGIRFYPWKRRVDFAHRHGKIHGIVWRMELMRGSIVTIHAIHPADRELCHVVCEISNMKFSDFSFAVGEAHPGDDLVLFIGGDVFNFIGDVHVPMYPARPPL